MLKCPICNKELKSLNTHVVYEHNISIKDFKKKYPGMRLQEDKRVPGNFVCHICGKTYSYNNVLAIHIKTAHPKEYKKIKEAKDRAKMEKEASYKYTCAICGKRTNQIMQHVVSSHFNSEENITWKKYCKQYNHSINDKAYFSQEHLKNLSINKSKYYSSNKGLVERKRLSVKFSGDGNPSKRFEVRKKISDSAIKRIQTGNNPFMENSYGIKFKFSYNGKVYHTRSFEEFKVLWTLLINDIEFTYEKLKIDYLTANGIPKTYLLDFLIQKTKYVEIKSAPNKKHFDVAKYEAIEKILQLDGKHLNIWNYADVCENLNLEKMLNSEFYRIIKELLDKDQCQISCYVHQHSRRSRILEAIDLDFMNNKNIKVFYKDEKSL